MNKIITIGREFGSGGREFGARLAENLGFAYYDKQILTEIVNHTDFSEEYISEVVEKKKTFVLPTTFHNSMSLGNDYQLRTLQTIVKAQTDVIKEMALKSSCVIVGRCADYILEDFQDIELIRLFIYADFDSRIKRCIERAPEGENLTEKELIKRIKNVDKNRSSYYGDYTLRKWGDKANYDLCINTTNLKIEDIVPHFAKMFS